MKQTGFKVFNDLSGQQIEQFLVLRRVDPPETRKDKISAYFLCRCVCKKEIIVKGSVLSLRRIKSCGCLNKFSSKEEVQFSSYMKYFQGIYSDGNLKIEDFIFLVNKNCFYCGRVPYRKLNKHTNNPKSSKFALENGWILINGIDRINSSQPHNKDNCVTCCENCNLFKLNRSYEDTINHIKIFQEDFKLNNYNNINKVSNLLKENNLDPTNNSSFSKLFPIKLSGRRDYYLLSIISKWRKRKERIHIQHNFSTLLLAEFLLDDCSYCGIKTNIYNKKIHQIDRIDNNIDYELNNCCSACKYCNSAKSTYSLEDFREWFFKIKNNIKNIPQTNEELQNYINNRIIK